MTCEFFRAVSREEGQEFAKAKDVLPQLKMRR